MAVLVTGGAGYIGSHMVLALLDAGEEVVVLDNLSTGFDWALPPEAKLVVGDMGDQDLVGRVIGEHGVKAIAHFAAKIVVPESVADPLGYYLNNTVKSRALIEAAIRGGVEHFIFSSTAAVYGNDYPTPDGSCLRDYIQVSDLAAAHLDALTHLRGGGESLTLNCGYGTGYSVFEVIEVVKRVSGINFEVRLSPRRAGDPAAIVAKADRIRERLGWQPRYDDLTTIVDQALRWEKALLTRNQI
jgi:UDP-glucose 4-epimerase